MRATCISNLTFRVAWSRPRALPARSSKRAILHRNSFALLIEQSNRRRGLHCFGLLSRGSITARYSNCERHPVRRQRDDGCPQIREVWFQGDGHEQIEWQFSDGHDYGPRTLYEGSLHRSIESRGARPWNCSACLSERVSGNKSVGQTRTHCVMSQSELSDSRHYLHGEISIQSSEHQGTATLPPR